MPHPQQLIYPIKKNVIPRGLTPYTDPIHAASASYIAAPAAIRISLPEANPTLYLTSSLAITFPFNITLGVPIYLAMARMLYP